MKASGATRASFIITATGVCALVIAGALYFAGGVAHSSVNSATDNKTERTTIAIDGMYCNSCASGIKAMLMRTPGVVAADVSYERKEAIVDYDQRQITPEKIAEAINNLGYRASIKNRA